MRRLVVVLTPPLDPEPTGDEPADQGRDGHEPAVERLPCGVDRGGQETQPPIRTHERADVQHEHAELLAHLHLCPPCRSCLRR